jgi:chemotaxis protein MotA
MKRRSGFTLAEIMLVIAIIGVLAGFGLILLGQILEGGHVSSILQPTAALIVFGGTLGATLTCFPLNVSIGSLKRFISVFFGQHHNAATLAKELLEYAALSRKKSLLALQKFQPNIKKEFLSKGLQLVIDAVPEKALREMMEREMTEAEQHELTTPGGILIRVVREDKRKPDDP